MTEVVLNPLRCFRRLNRGLRREDGNSLIETALILPVLFLMIFGFSLMIFRIGNTNFASRAALRYSTLHSATSYSAATQQDLNNIVRPYVFSFPANTWVHHFKLPQRQCHRLWCIRNRYDHI